jgi:transposase-like protein
MKKTFSPEYKVKVALEAIKGLKPMSEIASVYGVHPTQIGFWKNRLIRNASVLFTDKRAKNNKPQDQLVQELYKLIGQRDVELEWMKKNLQSLDT